MTPAARSPRSTADAVRARFDDVRAVHTGPRFAVYTAIDRAGRRRVAVKVPTDADSAWLADVLDHEAAVLSAVGAHPNIVPVYERVALGDGRPALLLEPARASLADGLPNGRRVPLREVLGIGVQLAGALETVHARGFVHGDVRPANILLGEWDQPLLSGFEEARSLGADAGSALHVTTPHTAPELLEGSPATPATDVYGLASTLYELVAGRTAFRAYAGESPAKVIVRVLSGQVRPIVAPGVPIDMSDLLTWAMAGNPAERPPSPAWLAEEFGRIERRQGWPRTRLISA
jgi:serine/threonine protein kinase